MLVSITDHKQVIVGVSIIYIMGYNGMVATYAWLCGGEFPSQRLRSYTFGLAAAVGFFGAWLASFTAPFFINPDALNWGPKYGYIWTPICWIGALWTFFYLPEVQNRKFEEIDEMVCLTMQTEMLSLTFPSSRPAFLRESSALTSAMAPLWLLPWKRRWMRRKRQELSTEK